MSALGRLTSILDKQIQGIHDRIDAMRAGKVTTATDGKEDTAASIARDVETVSQLMIIRSRISNF